MANSPREILDALVRDAAEQQSVLGRLPTPGEIATELTPMLETLDRKIEASESKAAPAPKQPDRRDIAEEFTRLRGIDAGDLRVERKPDSDVVAPLNRSKSIEAMAKRMRLLRLQPKYQQQIKDIAGCVMDKRDPQRRVDALRRAVKMLRDSEAVFGPLVEPEKAPTLYSIGPTK